LPDQKSKDLQSISIVGINVSRLGPLASVALFSCARICVVAFFGWRFVAVESRRWALNIWRRI
jgi:hypothetical protein